MQSLDQIRQRGGAIELSVRRGANTPGPRPESASTPSPGAASITGASEACGSTDDGWSDETVGGDVVYRVKLVRVSAEAIEVEPPAAFGQSIRLAEGVDLVGAYSIGQNRWMFETRVMKASAAVDSPSATLTLAAPRQVERCSRRFFHRMSTAQLRLPRVYCWPLMDPLSAVAAETANQIEIEDQLRARLAGVPNPRERGGNDALEGIVLPEVGPMFTGRLVNISGGGLGVIVDRTEARGLDARPHLWVRLDLRPYVPAPIGVTTRMVHAHIDSAQNHYAGLSFDFTHNPKYRDFVLERFRAYVNTVMSEQRESHAA